VLVDEGAEAGSVLPFAKETASLAARVRGFVATPASNAELWAALSARLHAGTLSIPRHERLLAELRGLRLEAFAFGSRWRVIDASRRFHRDVAVSLALEVHAAGELGVAAADIGLAPGADAPGDVPAVRRGFHGRALPATLARHDDAQRFHGGAERPRIGFWR
jgi:hypothetical protein